MVAANVAHDLLAHGFFAHGGGDSVVPPLTAGTTFTRWELVPSITAGVVVAALLYLAGVWRVRRDHPARPWPLLPALSFLAGLLAIVVATQSSIGAYDGVLFSMHMWQHLLLLMVAPPLLVCGQPVTLLLHASSNPLHSWVKRVVRSRPIAFLTHPMTGIALYAAVVVGTHLTSFMNLVLTDQWAHDVEHVLYLVAGYLYFLPLVGREPIRWRLSYPARVFFLFLVMPVDTFTGVVLTQTNHVLFPAYEGRRDWGPSVLSDLHGGGAVMWIAGDGIMVLIIVAVFVYIVRHREQIDAGRWLEGIRARRLHELAGISESAGLAETVRLAERAGLAQSAGLAELAGVAEPADVGRPAVPTSYATDDDDRELDAYNAYLARLNSGHHGSGAAS
jgi:cytochrome c oxidase assembly factor CtaG